MSPWSIVVETFRITLKPLALAAVVMALVMLLPDSGIAATSLPAAPVARPAAAVRTVDAAPLTRQRPPQPVSTVTRHFDLGRLPPTAFGDHDHAR